MNTTFLNIKAVEEMTGEKSNRFYYKNFYLKYLLSKIKTYTRKWEKCLLINMAKEQYNYYIKILSQKSKRKISKSMKAKAWTAYSEKNTTGQ